MLPQLSLPLPPIRSLPSPSTDGWTDRGRPPVRPSVRLSCMCGATTAAAATVGTSFSFPHVASVRSSDRSGTLGARPMHRVGLRHLSTLPLPLVRRREDGQPNARAAAGRSFGMRLATGDGATSDRLPGRQAGHTHGPTVGRTATPRRRRRRRAKKEWSLG